MIARNLRELVSTPVGPVAIEAIILNRSGDLICKNIFCEKVSQACLCRLEHALASPHLDLTLIKKVDISTNKLTSLPPSLEKMINLEELDVSGNNISVLPVFLKKLTKLSSLNVAETPLERKFGLPKLTHEDLLSISDDLLAVQK